MELQRYTKEPRAGINSLLEAAKTYWNEGLNAVPCTKKKVIAGSEWSSLQKNFTNQTDFYKREAVSNYGLAIVTGRVSKNLTVIDIDHKYDLTGNLVNDLFNYLYENHCLLFSKLRIIKTPTNGYHFYFRSETIGRNQKLANRYTTPEERKEKPDELIKVLIETRGEGGLIVAPPTPGYEVFQDSPIPELNEEEVNILFEAARGYNEVYKIHEPVKQNTYTGESPFEITPWEDFNERGDAVDILLSHGWRIDKKDSQRVYLTRPGKDRGCSGDYHNGLKLFKSWSTSVYGFEPETAYGPTAVYSMLECNGDFKEASKKLEQLGYGRRKAGEIKNTQSVTKIEEAGIDEIIARSLINPDTPVPEPKKLLSILQAGQELHFLDEGTLSLITAKAKAKKTFLTTAIAANVLTDNPEWNFINRADKKGAVVIDTEQHPYKSQRIYKRICKKLGVEKCENLFVLSLRKETTETRLKVIEKFLQDNRDKISLCVIDGLRDLVYDINDYKEATHVMTLLMRWSAEFGIHILLVLHQNKNDFNARGAIGTEAVNKADLVIGLTMNKETPTLTTVEPEFSRELDFDPFGLVIDEHGIPGFVDLPEHGNKESERKGLTVYSFDEEVHKGTIRKIFTGGKTFRYSELVEQIKLAVQSLRGACGENKAKEFLTHFSNQGWIGKTGAGRNAVYSSQV